MKYIKITAIFLILQIAIGLCLCAQEDGVTKYTVKEYLEANLPPQEGRRIALDEITGLLTITDTPKNQKLALELIREWDIGPKQISIEAKFIEITFTDLDEMGLDWRLISDEWPLLDIETGMMGTTSVATFKQAANAAGMGLFIGKATMHGVQLLSYLKALRQSGKVNLLHAPRITTLSGQMANIQVLRSFPYASSVERTEVDLSGTAGEDTGTSTSEIFPVETYEINEEVVGISLEVTPRVIEGSDIITLDIHPEVTKLSRQIDISSLTALLSTTSLFPSNLGWPVIDTRSTQTSLMVRSGDTIIMGGLIQDQDENTVERKIPFLGDIPLLGPLFRYKYEKREKKNLVILLTANIISAQGKEIR